MVEKGARGVRVDLLELHPFRDTWLPIIISGFILIGTGLFLFANTNGWIGDLSFKKSIIEEKGQEYRIITDSGNCWVIKEEDYQRDAGHWKTVYHSEDLNMCIQKIRDMNNSL